MAKYLDDNGLLYLWSKIKSLFVTKETGKGLSSNDFTNDLKSKLDGIESGANNYTLPTASTTTIGGVKIGAGLEIKADGTLNSTYGGTADSVDWSGVQNKPTTIAGYGITDVESGAEANVQADWNVSDSSSDAFIKNKPTIPSKTSDLTNDSGYLTEHQDISGKADKATTLAGYGIADAYTKDEVDGKISSTYKPQGTSAFASLPTPSAENLGYVYNVNEAFTTNATFLEGAGKTYPAGSNVVVIQSGASYLYDVQGGFYDMSPYMKTSDMVAITNSEIDTVVAT